jgi:hypothetical protein
MKGINFGKFGPVNVVSNCEKFKLWGEALFLEILLFTMNHAKNASHLLNA